MISDKYFGVYKNEKKGVSKPWKGQLGSKKKLFKTEKEAAIFVDIKFIEEGKKPKNILKKL